MPTPLEELENELVDIPNRVLVITGAGISIATDPTNPCASWLGLLKHGKKQCSDRCPTLPPEWFEIIDKHFKIGKVADFIAIATATVQALGGIHLGEYARWLDESLGQLKVMDDRVIKGLLSWGVRVATTNGDNLIEEVSQRGSITWKQSALAIQFLRGKSQDILHLHGHYRDPDSIVLDARSYEDVCRDMDTQQLLKYVLTVETVVFVGCGAGTEDPNFGSLLSWSRNALKSCKHSHFRLVRRCEQAQVEDECRELPIRTIVYGDKYEELGPFLSDLGKRVLARRLPPNEFERLLRSQADHEARLHELDSQRSVMTPSEDVRRHFEAAQQLWNAGGKREAALHMHSTVRRLGSSLSGQEKLQYGLEAAEKLLDDNLDFHAMITLRDLEPTLRENEFLTQLRGRYHELLARYMTSRSALSEMMGAIEEALSVTPVQERGRLEAERAEIYLLQGGLDEALHSIQHGDRQ